MCMKRACGLRREEWAAFPERGGPLASTWAATKLPDFPKLLLTLLFNLREQVSLGADLPR